MTPGSTFGDYKVVRLLGKGGMGEVWLLEGKSGRQVAAKILEAGADHEARKRFLREAQLALGVRNPNLVEAYDVGIDPGSGLCYILMEYVSGGTLADRIKARGALPIDEAVSIVQAMASVLELGRQKGIVHRDIKPANIMFDAEGTPKLSDLGIARAGAGTETTTVTQAGAMIGTPAYMSPEQMLDSHNVDTRADIYSLGVVFFEMLTGQRPNKDDTALQLMAKAIKGEPLPDVRTLRPEVSASLAQLLNMMVAPKRDGRIATPGQIASAIDIIQGGGVFSPPRPLLNQGSASGWHDADHTRDRKPHGRRFALRDILLCCIAVLAIVAVGVAVVALQRGHMQNASASSVEEAGEARNYVRNGPYGIRLTADAGCEKGAENIYRKLVDVYLPTAARYYCYPISGQLPKRIVPIRISRDAKNPNNLVRRSIPGFSSWKINLAEQSDDYTGRLDNLTSSILCVCEEPSESMFRSYVDHLVMADIDKRERSQSIRILVEEKPRAENGRKRDAYLERRAKWYLAYEEVRAECPDFISRYSRLKNERFASGKIESKIALDQMVRLMEEASGVAITKIFKRYGIDVPAGLADSRKSDYVPSVAEIDKLLRAANPRVQINIPVCATNEATGWMTNPIDAQKKAKELGLWIFVYNMPFGCIEKDDFPNSKSFAKFMSKHFVLLAIDGFGSSSDPEWVKGVCWPSCSILDSEGKLVSPIARWSGTLVCHTSGEKMLEIVKGCLMSMDRMGAAFSCVERMPNCDGLCELHKVLSSIPESFVNIAYSKWAELLVSADSSGNRGWRNCYPYASRVLSVISAQDWAAYWKKDYEFQYDRECRKNGVPGAVLGRIDANELEDRITILAAMQKRLNAIDRQSLSDDAQHRLDDLMQDLDRHIPKLRKIRSEILSRNGSQSDVQIVSLASDRKGRNERSSRVTDKTLRFARIGGHSWCYSLFEGGAVLQSAKRRALASTPCVDFSPEGVLSIPSELDGFKVVEIGRFAFNRCKEISSVVIPDTVSKIGYGAFNDCHNLEAVTFPSGMTSFDGSSFKRCHKLAHLSFAKPCAAYRLKDGVLYTAGGDCVVFCPPAMRNFPKLLSSVISIGDGAFCGCAIDSATIPDRVTKIGHGAFSFCENLRTLELPSSIRDIDSFAFGYSGLRMLRIPEGVRRIEGETFRGCANIERIEFPDSLEEICGHATFVDCVRLRELEFNEGLRVLGESQLFGGCSSLKRLVIPSTVRTMSGDEGTFGRCDSLAEIVFCGDKPKFSGSVGNRPFGNAIFVGAPRDLVVIVKRGSKGWFDEGCQITNRWPVGAGDNEREIRYEDGER